MRERWMASASKAGFPSASVGAGLLHAADSAESRASGQVAGGARRGEGRAVVLVDVDPCGLADRGWRACDDVGDREGPSFRSSPDGHVRAKVEFAVPDAAGDGVDDRL